MYSYTFNLINDELNSIIPLKDDKNTYDLMKIEIYCNDIKFIFLSHDKLTVRVMNYELDLISLELIFKNDYKKPYTDKYFR